MTARVVLDNADARWTPGLFVEGRVTIGTTPVELAVPLSALQRFRDFDVVFAQVGDIYEVRMLELGRRDARCVEVLDGLDARRPRTSPTTASSSRPTSRSPARATTTDGRDAHARTIIVARSVRHRWLVLLAVAALAALGVCSYQRLPIDAVPDITNVQVQINTEAPGFSPLEAEQRITFPIETAMAGLPRLDYTRSLSRYGLSQVTVVFEDGTDIYFARQLVDERLQQVARELPPGLEPELGPIATGLGEIFMYTVERSAGRDAAPTARRTTPTDLRTVQDWIIRPQLAHVPGVTEVNTIGGYERQYHVTPRPDRAARVRPHARRRRRRARAQQRQRRRRLHRALRRAVPGARAGPGRRRSTTCAAIVVATRDGAPIRVGDVADVGIGKELRTGAATQNGEEVVLGTVFMLIGENSRDRRARRGGEARGDQRVAAAGRHARAPSTTARRSSTAPSRRCATNLLEGALLVIAVLFLLLGNFRAALITRCGDPALDAADDHRHGRRPRVSGNLMSLGALDFGLIVDGAVIIVENCLRRLRRARSSAAARAAARDERLDVVRDGDERSDPAEPVRRAHHHRRLPADLRADRRRGKDVPPDGVHGRARADRARCCCR